MAKAEIVKIETRFKRANKSHELAEKSKEKTFQNMKKALQYAVDAGRELSEIKREIPHGEWGNALSEHFTGSERSARNYIKVYEAWGNDELPEGCTLTEAYKLLSEKSVCKSATVSDNGKNKGLTDENIEPEDDLLDDIEGLEDEETEESTDDDFEYEQPKVVKKTDAVVVDKPSKDRFGQKVPAKLNDVFATDTQYNQWRNQISDVKSDMIEVGGQPGFERIEEKFIKARFENLFELIRIARPYCVCPVCSGDGGVGSVCGYCKGNGWMTKQVFHATPEEFKTGLKNYKVKK